MDSMDNMINSISRIYGFDSSQRAELVEVILKIACEYSCKLASEKVADLILDGAAAGMTFDDAVDFARKGMRLWSALQLMGGVM